MAAVPVILNGTLMPKGKGGRGRSADDQPIPAVFIGYLSIQGLEIGGGPIIPDNPPVDPGAPHPEHPIASPPDGPPVDPPVDPTPPDPGSPNVVLVLKSAPVTGGWGLAQDPSDGSVKWFYSPPQSGAGPKR